MHTHTHTHISLMKYLPIPDNARDAVFLHVPTSSERQERGNETGLMKKRTNHSPSNSVRVLFSRTLLNRVSG
jgi:hypothetical protein